MRDLALEIPEKRNDQILLVKDWVIAAAKMGAPNVRVSAGRNNPPGHSREKRLKS